MGRLASVPTHDQIPRKEWQTFMWASPLPPLFSKPRHPPKRCKKAPAKQETGTQLAHSFIINNCSSLPKLLRPWCFLLLTGSQQWHFRLNIFLWESSAAMASKEEDVQMMSHGRLGIQVPWAKDIFGRIQSFGIHSYLATNQIFLLDILDQLISAVNRLKGFFEWKRQSL